MNGVIPCVNSVSTRITPSISLVLVHNRVVTLEIYWVLEECFVLRLDNAPGDLLLNNCATPFIVLQPGLFNNLLTCNSLKQTIFQSSDVQINSMEGVNNSFYTANRANRTHL